MILYPLVVTQLDLTTENLSDEDHEEDKNTNIDLENIEQKNGNNKNAEEAVKVNYGYEKE